MEALKFYSFPSYLRFGGDRLKKNLCKFKEDVKDDLLAEAWELADHNTHSSEVSAGKFRGTTLGNLLKKFEKEILGDNSTLSDGRFPIMIRLLDVNEDLPPAVHPDEEYAQENSLPDNGKYEAAYVLEADEDAKFYYGIKNGINLDNPAGYADSGKSFLIMNEFNTKAGDCFYVEPKILHSWGRGNLIYEVHTTSNLIYPLDWLSWDKDQERRNSDLAHLEKIIIPSSKGENRILPVVEEINGLKKETLCSNEHFVLKKITTETEISLSDDENRFCIYTIINGSGIVRSDLKKLFHLDKYETMLIPASCKNTVFKPNQKVELLKVYIPPENI